jgi:hypothetical protein
MAKKKIHPFSSKSAEKLISPHPLSTHPNLGKGFDLFAWHWIELLLPILMIGDWMKVHLNARIFLGRLREGSGIGQFDCKQKIHSPSEDGIESKCFWVISINEGVVLANSKKNPFPI